MSIQPPRHIVWSTNSIDLDDPFQRCYYIRQVLLQGRTEDIQTLDLNEVAAMLHELRLPDPVHALWARFFQNRCHAQG